MKTIPIFLILLMAVCSAQQPGTPMLPNKAQIRDSLICRAVVAADTVRLGKKLFPPHTYGPITEGGGLRKFARDTSRFFQLSMIGSGSGEAGEKMQVFFHLETTGTALDTFFIDQKNMTGDSLSADSSWTRVQIYQPEREDVIDSVAILQYETPTSPGGNMHANFSLWYPFNDIVRVRRRTAGFTNGNGIVYIHIHTRKDF